VKIREDLAAPILEPLDSHENGTPFFEQRNGRAKMLGFPGAVIPWQ